MDNEYTKREIEHFFKEIKDVLVKQDAVLIEIRTEVKNTNERVSLLEFWKEGLMAKITGVMAVISIGWVLFKEFILNK